MYTLRVRAYRHIWRWGLRQYETIQEAQKRVQELADVGIEAIICETPGSIKQEHSKKGGLR